ncbi:MAG: Stk1 family PASTA domain-containing Ser/Thr kinase [Tumebacillaceae bacterium]
MAVVYRALDTLLNRNVSIKVLRAQFSTDEDFVRRFRREAQAAASLSHPNVVNIYDVGVEGEDYYIVMEYIDGMTLKEVIQDRAPLPVGESIDVAKQICAALGHAHENNIVHRDIKPHNILIGKDGRVKVTDFGIARAITSNTITQDGSVLGSVHYFSPEQARGGITDVKSDIYSLGVVLYEMVTGELPFSGETPISVALKHLQEHFVEPRQINPSLPQSVENIVLKALAKDPTVRYQTAREMFRDLEKALLYPNVPKFTVPLFDEQQTIQMPAVGLRNSATNPPVSRTGETKEPDVKNANAAADKPVNTDEQPEKKKRKFWRPVIWLVVIFLLLGVGAVSAYLIVTNYMGVKDVTMPNVVGETYDQAVKDLVKAGLDQTNIHRSNTTDSNGKPVNTVLQQDQYAGKTIKANREVTLTVATGPQKFAMPNVVSLNKQDAINQLKTAGVPDGNITTEDKEDANATPGTVLAQTPTSGNQVDATVSVKLTVAKAITQVNMPDLTGKTVNEAKTILQGLGLTVNQTIPKAPQAGQNVPKDHILQTGPYEAGSKVPKGTAIDLYVSTGATDDQNAAKKKVTAVTVDLPAGEQKVNVKILKTDARGANQVEVDGEEITQKKTYNVECVLKSDTYGSIMVYLDGQLTKTIPVTYDTSTTQQ